MKILQSPQILYTSNNNVFTEGELYDAISGVLVGIRNEWNSFRIGYDIVIHPRKVNSLIFHSFRTMCYVRLD